MRLTIKIFLFLAILLSQLIINAQDIHFSQFLASPLSLNPAETGNYTGDWRVMNNYRKQWSSITIPYETVSLGFDKQELIRNQRFSWGMYYLNDKSGGANLNINKLFASASYHKAVGNSQLHFGAQLGYVNKSYSQNITFPNQFDNTSGSFNSSIESNETALGNQDSYVDVNAGLLWTARYEKIAPYFGVSFFHINMPTESFSTQNNKLPIRYSVNAGSKIFLGANFYINPNAIYMEQIKSSEMLLGSHFGVNLINKMDLNTVFIGAYLRNGIIENADAFVGVVGVKIKNFDIGFSYDFNISNLNVISSYKGGFEISLIYTAPSTFINKISIPCDRY